MLTDQQLESARKSQQQRDIITSIVDSLPEDQWLAAIDKALPNQARWYVMQVIMIHRGGDIIVNSKQSLG